MKKIILIISILLSGIYITNFISAVSVNLNSGDTLTSDTWGKISSVTDKISVSGGDMKINGKIYISGDLCTSDGICLGKCNEKYEWNNDTLSCEQVISGTSCKNIYDSGETTNGNYIIDIDGDGGEDAFEVYCDMTNASGGWTHVITFGSSSVLTDNAIGGKDDTSFKLSSANISLLLGGGTSGEIMIDFNNGKRTFLKLARGPLTLQDQAVYFKFDYNDSYHDICTHASQEGINGTRHYFFVKASCSTYGNCTCQSSNYENMIYEPTGFYNGDGTPFWGGTGWSSDYKMYVKY